MSVPGAPVPPGRQRWDRAVLHVDMDAFYVSVELLRRPELRGRPVVVGGTGRRGVVASASYEARAYGVRSAMPMGRARRLCPHATVLPGDHARYGEVSTRVMAIFARFTPLVEPLSLDEAFLDVTGAQRRLGRPEDMAATVRRQVADEEGLSCTVGVAPNKFLAKLGSEAAKPRPSVAGPVPGIGVQVVRPGRELEFLHPLPLRALWGVGPATLERLGRLGIATVGELAALPTPAVVGAVGDAVGRHLSALSRGEDDRPVVPDRAVKSVGHEETFPYDLFDAEVCERELLRLADAVAGRLRRQQLTARTVTLKVRFGDFRTVTRSHTLATPTASGTTLAEEARRLFRALPLEAGIRLLGVSGSGFAADDSRQLTFDDLSAGAADTPEGRSQADRAIDAIRDRFGAAAIGPAALADPAGGRGEGGGGGGLRVLRPGARQWGPDEPPGPSADADVEGG